MREFRYFLSRIIEDVESSHCTHALLILRDDGVFNNYTRDLIEQAGAAPDLFAALCRHRIAVFCHAPEDLVADRVAQRSAAGVTHPHHRGLDQAGLIQDCANALALKSRLADLLAAQGVPLLTVDLSADLPANLDRVSAAIAQQARTLTARDHGA